MAGVMNPGQRDTSILSTVMKGLSIARDIYGIKADMSRLEAAEANEAAVKAERERVAAGKLNRGEIQSLKFAGAAEVPKGTPGAVDVATTEGNGLTLLPKRAPPKEAGGSWQKVAGPDGGPVMRWVADRSGDFRPHIEPKESKTPGQTTDLRKEYNSDPTTKRTLGIIDAHKAITGALSTPNPTGATDIRMVYSFMKMMDPGSTVREGEYATAENSGGVPDKVTNVYNRLTSGERLTPEQRQAFAAEAESLMQSQLESQKDTDARYAELAKQYGLKPEQVIDSRFSRVQNKPAAPTQKSGEAFAAPGDAIPGASADELKAEIEKRKLKLPTAPPRGLGRGHAG